MENNVYQTGGFTFSFKSSNTPPMKKYEYRTLVYSASPEPKRLNDFIEPWAREGWRIVSTVATGVNGYRILLFLERERQN